MSCNLRMLVPERIWVPSMTGRYKQANARSSLSFGRRRYSEIVRENRKMLSRVFFSKTAAEKIESCFYVFFKTFIGNIAYFKTTIIVYLLQTALEAILVYQKITTQDLPPFTLTTSVSFKLEERRTKRRPASF